MAYICSPIFIIIFSTFSLFIIISIISIIECKSHVFKFYSIYCDKVKRKYRIVYFSDFHDKLFKNEIKIVNSICNLEPDFIFIGGDLIDFSSFFSIFKKPKLSNAIHFVEKLSNCLNNSFSTKNYNSNRIFFSLGNHESRLRIANADIFNKFIENLKLLSINILDGSKSDINNDLSISGFNIYEGYYGKFNSKSHLDIHDINLTSNMLDKCKYNIALLHKPDYIEDLINYGYDLVLSGHNHGGLIKLKSGKAFISPDFKLFPKYNYGLYSVNGKNAIVTNGIGEHFIKIRVNNIPEIVVIDIN